MRRCGQVNLDIVPIADEEYAFAELWRAVVDCVYLEDVQFVGVSLESSKVAREEPNDRARLFVRAVLGAAGLLLLVGVIRERRPEDWWRAFRYRRLIRERSCEYSTAT